MIPFFGKQLRAPLHDITLPFTDNILSCQEKSVRTRTIAYAESARRRRPKFPSALRARSRAAADGAQRSLPRPRAGTAAGAVSAGAALARRPCARRVGPDARPIRRLEARPALRGSSHLVRLRIRTHVISEPSAESRDLSASAIHAEGVAICGRIRRSHRGGWRHAQPAAALPDRSRGRGEAQ